MTTADLTLINAALTRTGNEPITSLTGGAASQRVAASNYEEVVKNELALHPWKKATKIEQLDRLDPDIVGEPPEPWTAAYQLPTDLVEIRTIRVAGLQIDYEQHGDTLVCNAGESDAVILHYVWRVPETWFPPWLREGIIRRMEAVFLRGIGERYDEGQVRDKAADEQFAKARHRDSQGQTARDPVTQPTLLARRGTSSLQPTDRSRAP